MKQHWEKISEKVMALSQRERVLVLVGMLAVLWVVFDTFALTPSLQKNKLYRKEIVERQQEVAQLQLKEVTVIREAVADPDAGNRAHLAQLKRQIAEMDAELQATGRDLIPPERMPRVLESLLQKNRQVKLVSLNTLPVSNLMETAALQDAKTSSKEAPAAPVFSIYKHGFQVTLEGSYPDLSRYVEALESSPWRMLWGDMDLAAGTYPKSTLTLTLYTLSLDKAWLSI